MNNKIKPWLTAIHRKKESVPIRTLIDRLYISKKDTILDYGCGHATDLNWLLSLGYNAQGYDKFLEPYSTESHFSKVLTPNTYSTIICFYVLNVIPTIEERIDVLRNLAGLITTNGNIFIAVRSEYEFIHNCKTTYTPYTDGIVTRKNTFQKYFSKDSLEELIFKAIPNCTITHLPFNKNTLLLKITKI